MCEHYYYLQFADTNNYFFWKNFYALVKNNVAIEEKVHEDERMAAKTP